MAEDIAYAHTREGEPPERWESLEVHLENVAALAEQFAAAFGCGPWGRVAGLWHDLGKYRPEFQRRLRGSREQVEHAGVGAALAASKGPLGITLAFPIAGHHAGLANLNAQGDTEQRCLRDRLAENASVLDHVRELIPSWLLNGTIPDALPFHTPPTGASRIEQDHFKARLELWIRFLFSALVDADYLATEAFCDPDRRPVARKFDSITTLRARLDTRLATFKADSAVNRVRAQVLQQCRSAAALAGGVFSLTVPTGGGKTLSSMAFALTHAEEHGLRRVIVVVPYTSIIEQNAAVYADYLGMQNVIEHHSNIDEVERRESSGEVEVRRRLAAENWDAPVIVTTNVQFFESLFANSPARCRKLHNVARSVVIFDEAQNLPPDYLNGILDVMRELASTYRCTLLLMTATQPALTQRDALPFGFPSELVHEIIADPSALARTLTRVTTSWPRGNEVTPYQLVAKELATHPRVMAVVHRRQDARALAQLLPGEDRFHLSALMCPAHRAATLTEIKQRLRDRLPCRLVTTQLVEAGVDIDFPVVFRALAGLDSLAQAAGRCNREGGLRDEGGNPMLGRFVVFRAETAPPPGLLRLALESTESLLKGVGEHLNFVDVGSMDEYFRVLYSKCEMDKKGIQTERRQLNFATVGHRVRLIEDGFRRPVVVPWGTAMDRVAEVERRPSREAWRALQPFVVQIPEHELTKLLLVGAVRSVQESAHVLTPEFAHLYHPLFGLVVDDQLTPDPAALVC